MVVQCVWEHNGNDTLLYASNLPGAYARGEELSTAAKKMKGEAASYLRWARKAIPDEIQIEILQDASCDLEVRDADSDVLFATERAPLSLEEYTELKALALKSASDFLVLYESVPDKTVAISPLRRTFYGQVPRTAEQMYAHTKNVNTYYFDQIGVDADNDGTIMECRRRGFELLEKSQNYLQNSVFEGSYGELWSLRKMLRRFIWHDRIHAKAMYRRAALLYGTANLSDPYFFCGSD